MTPASRKRWGLDMPVPIFSKLERHAEANLHRTRIVGDDRSEEVAAAAVANRVRVLEYTTSPLFNNDYRRNVAPRACAGIRVPSGSKIAGPAERAVGQHARLVDVEAVGLVAPVRLMKSTVTAVLGRISRSTPTLY
jgi:hypothetical protein